MDARFEYLVGHRSVGDGAGDLQRADQRGENILAAALQELIEAELTGEIGAAPGERSPDRCVAERPSPEVVVDTGG